MIVQWAPSLVTLAGLLMYLLAKNGKAVRIGELMFFAGLLVMLLHLGSMKI